MLSAIKGKLNHINLLTADGNTLIYNKHNTGMKKIGYIFIVLLLVHCKERYEIPTNSPVTGYLVVEGRINMGAPTSFQLSRTVKLSGDRTPKYELNARVQVEDQNNVTFPLADKGKGLYSADALNINRAQKYRLRIKTASGTEYVSDFVELKTTPVIDSVNWKWESDGVHIYNSTHDEGNNTRYYQWDFIETWEYHSAMLTPYKYQNNTVLLRTPEEQVYQCWTTKPATNIYIGSTAKLVKDVIFENLLVNIPTGSQKISVLYSINVKQYSLTKEAYGFLESMKKNTESLGSVFDPQPSELKGNIHSVTNIDEPVIGFVTAGTVAEKRIFINRTQLPGWPYSFACPNPDTLVYNHPDSLKKYFGANFYIPTLEAYGSRGLIGWYANETACVDCRLQGGVNLKPPFWP